MGTSADGGWSQVVTKKVIKVEVGGIEARATIEVPIQTRILCGKCNRPMNFAIQVDDQGDITNIAECECMFDAPGETD